MKAARETIERHQQALFHCTFPADASQREAAECELHGLAASLAARCDGDALRDALANSGIAGTAIESTFSLAATRWLVQRFGTEVELMYLDADPFDARTLLERALDPAERDALVDRAMSWPAWQRRYIGGDAAQRLARLIALVERLSPDEREQEAAWVALQVYIRWRMRADAPGLTQGRFGRNALHTHETGYIRSLSPEQALDAAPPKRVRLTPGDRAQLHDLGMGVMLSLLRETDFFTWNDPAQIECFDLGRGIQVALYPCAGARKLTLEAYIGYLLFKNHVPVAYGGAWILGPQAAFGVNVLPPYRGGESSLVVCQLLRLYVWRFRLQAMRVEASQIGKDNKDGIRSGSFWFYWRLGFRPLQDELRALAEAEWTRIMDASGGRPAARWYQPEILKRLAASVLVWRTPLNGTWRFVDPLALGDAVTAHVMQHFGGDRTAAQRAAIKSLGGHPSPSLARMAVLLQALAPPAGWTQADISGFHRLGHLKDSDEPAFALALQRHRGLVRALQRLSTA